MTGNIFLNIALFIAVACGCLAVKAGNRTAIPLLLSVFLSLGLIVWEYPANDYELVAIDLTVIGAIAWLTSFRNTTDILIIVLFIVAWSAMVEGGWTRYYGTWGVVIAQLFLTFPRTYVKETLMRRREKSLTPSQDAGDLALSGALLGSI